MADRLFVAVLGKRNAGKSSTWNELFGHTVRTGNRPRLLLLRPGECVEVFIVSGSFEERKKYAREILDGQSARIVLCSVQYIKEGKETIEYARSKSFDLYVQSLNPGYSDSRRHGDEIGLVAWLLSEGATIVERNGKVTVGPRVQEIREFIYGWAAFRSLIRGCSP